MKKQWYKMAFMALAAVSLTACSDDDDPVNPVTPNQPVGWPDTVGAYVLNTGNWGGNDASIQYYDVQNDVLGSDLYAAANGEGLGDLGQDLIQYGSKLYATVSGSSKVVVMDQNCKVLKSFAVTDSEGTPASPRYLTADKGNVYFTAYDGTVSRIDTLSLSINGKVEVGDHPEGIAAANGKLYVNISGYGSGAQVAVVDQTSFTKTKDLDVVLNPYTQCKVGSDGNVYIVSNGNYAGNSWTDEANWVYGTVQCINTTTDTVTELCRGSYIALYKNLIYVLYSEYYLPNLTRAFIYNIDTKQESDFIDLSTFSSPNSIDIDPVDDRVYISDASWSAPADVLIYDLDGNYISKFSAGYYTSKVIFKTAYMID
jgi:hypothetical protein